MKKEKIMNWIYDDNVDTDVIIPARYLNSTKEEDLKAHCMEDIDAEFSCHVKKGDYIIAGENFGCGSSREHAPLAIKASGIKAVIAKSFARIFYRNAINIGLVIVENSDIRNDIDKHDIIDLDLTSGKIYNKTKNKEYIFSPYSPEVEKIINAGGLVEYTKKKVEQDV